MPEQILETPPSGELKGQSAPLPPVAPATTEEPLSTPVTPPGDLVLAEELSAKVKEIEALQSQLQQQEKSEKDRVAEIEASQRHTAARIAELEAKERQASINAYLARLGGQILKDNNEVSYQVSPAYLQHVEQVISQAPHDATVVRDGQEVPFREVLEQTFAQIIGLATDGTLLNTMTELGKGSFPMPREGIEENLLIAAQERAKRENISYREALLKNAEEAAKP